MLPLVHSLPIYLIVFKVSLRTEVQGVLILRRGSRLDAFSGYSIRT